MRTAAWIEASRPKTLTIGLAPVIVGNALGFKYGAGNWLVLFLSLVVALLLQIGANLANDYYDFKQGADSAERVGFKRACASGAIHPQAMRRGFLLLFATATIAALPLIMMGGWMFAALTAFMVLCGIYYTKSSHSLGYLGLGECVVFVLFGPLSILPVAKLCGATIGAKVLLCSFPTGFLAAATILINNLRDIEVDKKAGKQTLCVRFGPRFGRYLYLILVMLAFVAPLKLNNWIALIPLSLAIPLIRRVYYYKDPRELNFVLLGNSMLTFFTAIMMALGLWT